MEPLAFEAGSWRKAAHGSQRRQSGKRRARREVRQTGWRYRSGRKQLLSLSSGGKVESKDDEQPLLKPSHIRRSPSERFRACRDAKNDLSPRSCGSGGQKSPNAVPTLEMTTAFWDKTIY